MTVFKMVKKLEVLNAEFKTYYCTILNQIEKDQDKFVEEQAVLDDHEDKVDNLMERLEDLIKPTETVMPHAIDMGDHRPVRNISA